MAIKELVFVAITEMCFWDTRFIFGLHFPTEILCLIKRILWQYFQTDRDSVIIWLQSVEAYFGNK